MEVSDEILKQLNLTRKQWEDFEKQFREIVELEESEDEKDEQ